MNKQILVQNMMDTPQRNPRLQELLKNVKDFLPVMKKENEKLEQVEDKKTLLIDTHLIEEEEEHSEEEEEEETMIQMNLALGVLEQQSEGVIKTQEEEEDIEKVIPTQFIKQILKQKPSQTEATTTTSASSTPSIVVVQSDDSA